MKRLFPQKTRRYRLVRNIPKRINREPIMHIHIWDLEQLAWDTAREVWLIQENGTRLPRIVVLGQIREGSLELQVVEAPACAWAEPDEIISFKGGPPNWTNTVATWVRKYPPGTFPGMSKREIWKQLSRNEPPDFGHEADRIFDALESGWLARHEITIQSDPDVLLQQLIRKRDTTPAALLAHAYLHHLSHAALENSSELFWVCDLLEKSPDPNEYQLAVRRGLTALSESINQIQDYKGLSKRTIKHILDIHKALCRRASAPYPSGFTHHPNVEATSYLL